MSDKTATFGIKIPVETNAGESANSVDALRKSIAESQGAVKAFEATLRSLRGKSEEVTEAKTKLRAAANAERDAISRSTLELGKQGKTLFDVGKKAGGAGKEFSNVKNAISAAGGPVATLKSKFESLTSILGGSGAAAGLAMFSIAALAAACVALAAGVGLAAISLGKFILEAGNELRTMSLFSEAASGSAANAKALGNQIEATARLVPIARKELHEMQLELVRGAQGSRMSGAAVVDTFNAVAQASGAMGKSVGKSIEDILTRGKLMGRMSLGIEELNGTGIQFKDVAKELAVNLKTDLGKAEMMLRFGRVKLDDGAKAMRGALEKRFGKLNLALMNDLPTLAQRLKDNFQALVKDVNLEPILTGLGKFVALFDQTTVSGVALKQMFTAFGVVLTKVFAVAGPFAEAFFKQIIIESLKLEIAIIRLGAWANKTFGTDFFDALTSTSTAISIAKTMFMGLVGACIAVGVAVAILAAPFVLVGFAIYGAIEAVKAIIKWWKEADWASMGTAITDGLVAGIKAGWEKVKSAVKYLGGDTAGAMRTILDSHSPSRVFEKIGETAPAGLASGIRKGAPMANSAVSAMVKIPTAMSGSAGSGGGAPISVALHMHFPDVKDGASVRQALNSPGFKAEFTRMIETVLMGAGVPTQGAT